MRSAELARLAGVTVRTVRHYHHVGVLAEPRRGINGYRSYDVHDLIRLLRPRYIEVWGKFLPRGGLSIDPYCNYGIPGTEWKDFARFRLLHHDMNPEKVDNR